MVCSYMCCIFTFLLSRSYTSRTLLKAGVTDGKRRWRTDPALILQGFIKHLKVHGRGACLEVMNSMQSPSGAHLCKDLLVSWFQSCSRESPIYGEIMLIEGVGIDDIVFANLWTQQLKTNMTF